MNTNHSIKYLLKRFHENTITREEYNELVHYIQDANYKEELLSLDDVGPIVAEHVLQFLTQERTKNIVKNLVDCGVSFKKAESMDSSGRLKDMVFVFTGSMDSMSRSEASKLVENEGGVVSSSLSKKVSFLVSGEASGSKLDKAYKLGISVLSEADFIKMLKA